jgi:hypothetical protein
MESSLESNCEIDLSDSSIGCHSSEVKKEDDSNKQREPNSGVFYCKDCDLKYKYYSSYINHRDREHNSVDSDKDLPINTGNSANEESEREDSEDERYFKTTRSGRKIKKVDYSKILTISDSSNGSFDGYEGSNTDFRETEEGDDTEDEEQPKRKRTTKKRLSTGRISKKVSQAYIKEKERLEKIESLLADIDGDESPEAQVQAILLKKLKENVENHLKQPEKEKKKEIQEPRCKDRKKWIDRGSSVKLKRRRCGEKNEISQNIPRTVSVLEGHFKNRRQHGFAKCGHCKQRIEYKGGKTKESKEALMKHLREIHGIADPNNPDTFFYYASTAKRPSKDIRRKTRGFGDLAASLRAGSITLSRNYLWGHFKRETKYGFFMCGHCSFKVIVHEESDPRQKALDHLRDEHSITDLSDHNLWVCKLPGLTGFIASHFRNDTDSRCYASCRHCKEEFEYNGKQIDNVMLLDHLEKTHEIDVSPHRPKIKESLERDTPYASVSFFWKHFKHYKRNNTVNVRCGHCGFVFDYLGNASRRKMTQHLMEDHEVSIPSQLMDKMTSKVVNSEGNEEIHWHAKYDGGGDSLPKKKISNTNRTRKPKAHLLPQPGSKSYAEQDGVFLYQHFRSNWVKETVECIHCNEVVSYNGKTSTLLLEHLKLNHQIIKEESFLEKIRRIDYETHINSDRISRMKNIKTDDLGFPDKCGFCGTSFDDDRLLCKHIHEQHFSGPKRQSKRTGEDKPKRRYQCDDCKYNFGHEHRLAIHRKKVHDKDLVIDGVTIEPVETLRGNDERTPCEVCGEMILLKAIEAHMTALHGNKKESRYPCDQCDNGFDSITKLIWHRREKHRPDLTIFQCDECPRTFNHMTRFKEHMKDHEGWRCPDCDQVFSQYHERREHYDKAHMLRMRHVCEFCHQRFWREDNLRLHCRTRHKDGVIRHELFEENDKKNWEEIKTRKKYTKRGMALKNPKNKTVTVNGSEVEELKTTKNERKKKPPVGKLTSLSKKRRTSPKKSDKHESDAAVLNIEEVLDDRESLNDQLIPILHSSNNNPQQLPQTYNITTQLQSTYHRNTRSSNRETQQHNQFSYAPCQFTGVTIPQDQVITDVTEITCKICQNTFNDIRSHYSDYHRLPMDMVFNLMS